jgi:hypothetical protein
MSIPRVVIQRIQARHQAGTNRIGVNVADQFKKTGFFFTGDGLAAVLEQVAGSVLPKVGTGGIPGKEATLSWHWPAMSLNEL